MDYNAPSFSTDPNADYVGKTASTIGSKVPPKAVMLTQREIVAAEKSAGLIPTNNDATQLSQAISRGPWVGTLAGTGDAATATLGTVVPALLQGMRVRGVASAANTTVAPKLTIIGIGSAQGSVQYPILKPDGTALAIGDIKVGRRYEFEVDGANPPNVLISGGGIGSASSGPGSGAVLNPLVVYEAAGSYSWVATSTSVDVVVVGAGGSGGGSTSAYTGGAGGGGGRADKRITGLTIGQSYTIVVGAGGAAVAINTTVAGNAGGTSSAFGVSATGGGGGAAANGATVVTGGAGGQGSGGDRNYAGQAGGASTPGGSYNNYPNGGGAVGFTGGNCTQSNSVAGSTGPSGNGPTPGAGGGGGYSSNAGYKGADGAVHIRPL